MTSVQTRSFTDDPVRAPHGGRRTTLAALRRWNFLLGRTARCVLDSNDNAAEPRIFLGETMALDAAVHGGFSSEPQVRSHAALRMMIGTVAVSLPVLVVAIVAIYERTLIGSISESYHHRYANSVFVGSMCAFAAFLWSYNYTERENRLGNFAAVAAAGVAVFSTVPVAVVMISEFTDPNSFASGYAVTAPSALDYVSGTVHFLCAFSLLSLLSIFCVVWANDKKESAQRKSQYFASAVLIWLGLAGSIGTAVIELLVKAKITGSDASVALRINSTAFLFFEIIMVEAFGFSWLVRGHADIKRAKYAVGAALVATTIILIMFSVHHSINLGAPASMGLVVTSALLGLIGVASVFAFLWPDRPRMIQDREARSSSSASSGSAEGSSGTEETRDA